MALFRVVEPWWDGRLGVSGRASFSLQEPCLSVTHAVIVSLCKRLEATGKISAPVLPIERVLNPVVEFLSTPHPQRSWTVINFF